MQIKKWIAKLGIGIFILISIYSAIFLLSEKIYKEPDSQKNNILEGPKIVQLPFENVVSTAWIDSKNLMILQKRIEKDGVSELWQLDFNIETREPKEIKVSNNFENGIFGTDISQKTYICLWNNKIRNTPDEFGTTIKLVSLDTNFNQIYELELYETVKIDSCDNMILQISEGNPVLEKFSKVYDTNTEKYIEDNGAEDKINLKISGSNTTKVIQNQKTVLEMEIPNKFWFVSKDYSNKSFAFIDYNNKVLMYLNP
jgi:hypothetical protein